MKPTVRRWPRRQAALQHREPEGQTLIRVRDDASVTQKDL